MVFTSGVPIPSKKVTEAVITGLHASGGNQLHALAAIEPLRKASPPLFEQCRRLIDADNIERAQKLMEAVPNPRSKLVVALIVLAVLASIATPIVLALAKR